MTGLFGYAALAVAVIVVQIGLVQHAIEHHPGEVDVACEYCAAGNQPAPPLPAAAPTAAHFSPSAVPSRVVPAGHPARVAYTHGARAPPARS